MNRICLFFFTRSHNVKEQNSELSVTRKHTRVELNYIFLRGTEKDLKKKIYFRETINKHSTITIIFYNTLDSSNYIEF